MVLILKKKKKSVDLDQILGKSPYFSFTQILGQKYLLEGDEALEKVAQRSGECPIPRSVQDLIGWVLEQF